MNTTVDCLLCFMKQALRTARLASHDATIQHQVMVEAGGLLSHLDMQRSPPENAVFLYQVISRCTGNPDPFAAIKRENNTFALQMREVIRKRIKQDSDPLYRSLVFATCGNIIDYAAQHHFNADTMLRNCETQKYVLNDYTALEAALTDGSEVLYLADNCGEIVFDALVVEQLLARGCRVTVAVRGEAIINDATMEDAVACGLTELCPVITNGTGCPGTPLASCSKEFQRYFQRAEIILSKGMGNFETLSDVQAPLYFLFMVKCNVVAELLRRSLMVGAEQIAARGEMVLLRQRNVLCNDS